jgi:hypothetical protein
MTVLTIWCLIIAVLAAAVAAGTTALARRTKLGKHRKHKEEHSGSAASALFNALFLAAFALATVLAITALQQAQSNAAAEGQALSRLYLDVGQLPDGVRLRAEIRDYTNTLINQEWPLLSRSGESTVADRQAATLSDQILAINPPNEAVLGTRYEAVSALDQALSARQQRLEDARITLPTGLLASLVAAAVVVVGHDLIAGLPHGGRSLVSLLAEAAAVATAVFIIFMIRAPYHGALLLDPDRLRTATDHFSFYS